MGRLLAYWDSKKGYNENYLDSKVQKQELKESDFGLHNPELERRRNIQRD